ncbi:hypothetical protein ACSSV4_003671 [Roseovarius sp. MBR-154]|jgi:hypothetical protein
MQLVHRFENGTGLTLTGLGENVRCTPRVRRHQIPGLTVFGITP